LVSQEASFEAISGYSKESLYNLNEEPYRASSTSKERMKEEQEEEESHV